MNLEEMISHLTIYRDNLIEFRDEGIKGTWYYKTIGKKHVYRRRKPIGEREGPLNQWDYLKISHELARLNTILNVLLIAANGDESKG